LPKIIRKVWEIENSVSYRPEMKIELRGFLTPREVIFSNPMLIYPVAGKVNNL
jgi:hypothetical protein